MPELPEAERAREALERHALGRMVADADDSYVGAARWHRARSPGPRERR